MEHEQPVKPDQAVFSASQPIYEALRNDILSGKLSGGVPLRQDEIARNHGVSKMPVREALMKLEAEGYVLFRKNKGATVREISVTELLNLMDIRVALECKALEMAIPNQIQSDFDEIAKILGDYSQSCTTAHWSEMNQKFHYMLYEPCGNAQLLEMITDIQRRIGPVTRVVVTEASGFERPNKEHQDILQACKQGDVERGVALLQAHIITTKKEAAARLRRNAF
ncbi:GntR family transcriptional regulator [Pelagibius litoralis]|uniref:GntR family transcriptional regulator n=1 Tax=Pelagibius litoralis TaxID=374515 RepID=A0A967F1J2_9PROT|nr:GntR family transcriptional regulator [Pelagibius litoralis]NIA71329.1 GntR family transcriptional regulator [Pelagibius litoralis]